MKIKSAARVSLRMIFLRPRYDSEIQVQVHVRLRVTTSCTSYKVMYDSCTIAFYDFMYELQSHVRFMYDCMYDTYYNWVRTNYKCMYDSSLQLCVRCRCTDFDVASYIFLYDRAVSRNHTLRLHTLQVCSSS